MEAERVVLNPMTPASLTDFLEDKEEDSNQVKSKKEKTTKAKEFSQIKRIKSFWSEMEINQEN